MIHRLIKRGLMIGSQIAENFLARGDIKFLVLDVLDKKPVHGYEIMNKIEDKFKGLYKPSPGTIYPTLQMLEDQGFIKIKKAGDKKVYEITKKGEEFVEKNKEKISNITKPFKENEIFPIIKEVVRDFKSLGRETIDLILSSTSKKGEELKTKSKKTKNVLSETIKDIRKIWKE